MYNFVKSIENPVYGSIITPNSVGELANNYLCYNDINLSKIIPADNVVCNELKVRSLNIKDKLRNWIIHYKVSHNSGNSLLSILRSEGIEVPKDIRTPEHL